MKKVLVPCRLLFCKTEHWNIKFDGDAEIPLPSIICCSVYKRYNQYYIYVENAYLYFQSLTGSLEVSSKKLKVTCSDVCILE